jgi:glycosyltransferase involved in cell wall biosynthesis
MQETQEIRQHLRFSEIESPLVEALRMPVLACIATAPISSAPDPRIESALRWCSVRGVSRLVLAAPFPLDPATLAFVRAQPQVRAILRWPGQEQFGDDEADGRFLPDDYSWQLPRACPRTLVFIDGRGALTARMITAALRRGVRRIVCAEGGTWRSKSVLLLALGKLSSKLVARCVNASGPGGSLCESLVDISYRRSMRPALAAAPLAFHERRLADVCGGPAGVVLACPTLVAGGAERQIVNTAVGLRAAGVGRITVLVARLHSPPGNAFFLDHLIAAGVEVREALDSETGRQRWLNTRRLAETAQGARTLSFLQRLPEAINQEVLELGAEISALNPSVVHCWLDYSNVRAGLAAVCAGVPRVVLSGRNVGPRHFPNIFEPFMRSTYRALLDRPGVVLTNNSHGGAADYAGWLGIDPARIPVIYNGLDLARVRKPPPEELARFRRDHDVPADAQVIGGMFRLSPEKRPMLWLEVAVRVAKQRADASFLLFGEGPLRPTMQRFIDQHGLGARVRLLPPMRRSDLALAAFDVMLLTSQWEGTPNVAIEAQAVGTPVLLTGGGGASEALDPGRTGLYIERDNPAAILGALLSLLSDNHRRLSMAAAAPAFAEARFGMAAMIDATERVYCDPNPSPCG